MKEIDETISDIIFLVEKLELIATEMTGGVVKSKHIRKELEAIRAWVEGEIMGDG